MRGARILLSGIVRVSGNTRLQSLEVRYEPSTTQGENEYHAKWQEERNSPADCRLFENKVPWQAAALQLEITLENASDASCLDRVDTAVRCMVSIGQ